MGTAPIVELARAYGLHPRLWLLAEIKIRRRGGRARKASQSITYISRIATAYGLRKDIFKTR